MKFALFCVRLRSCRVATPRSLAFRRTLSDPYRIGVCEISCFDAFYWKSKTVQRPFALHGFRIRIVGVNVCRMQMRACHAISIPLGKGVGDVLSGLAPCRPATRFTRFPWLFTATVDEHLHFRQHRNIGGRLTPSWCPPWPLLRCAAAQVPC